MPYSAQPALLPHPRRCLPGRPGFWPRPSLLTGAGLLTALLSLSPAVADLVPEPPAECVGKPDGTFCSLGDGTAGQCVTEKDARRPGRSYQGCKKDTHECDRLAVGAVCHGYLGKPAHCREFRSPERGETWRSCQADDPPPASAEAPAATSPSAPPAAPTATASPAAPEPAKKGRFGCQVALGGRAAPLGWGALPFLGLLTALALRPRRQKTRA